MKMCPMPCLGYTYTKKVGVIVLKVKYNWSHLFAKSDNPTPHQGPKTMKG